MEDVKQFQCVEADADQPQRFFGNRKVKGADGQEAFPQFAWNLHGREIVVRDGKQLRPEVDYLDTYTLQLQLFMPFFVPSSQVNLSSLIRCNDVGSCTSRYVSVQSA